MDERAADSPPSWRGDLGCLAALLVLGLAVRGWIVAHTEVAARDSIGFIRYALHLENPPPWHDPGHPELPPEPQNRLDVVRHAEQPPGYPLAVLAASLPVRHRLGTTCDSLVLSAQLASLTAGVLLVVPMFFLGQALFGRWVGFAAAALFQCLPGPAGITSDALSESTFLLVLTATLLGSVHALRRPTPLRLGLCGFGGGLAYLVRPEGMLVVVALGLTVLLTQLTSQRRPWKAVAGGLAGLAVGAAVLVGPYAGLIGGLTNKPTPNKVMHGSEGDGPPGSAGPPLAAIFAAWDSEGDSHQARAVWAVRTLLKETTQDFQYAGAVLAVIGLICLPRRRPVDPGRALLLTLALIHAAVLIRMAVVIGYLSERHTLLLVLIGSFWAAAALPILAGQLVRLPTIGRRLSGAAVATLLLVAFLGTGVAGALKPLHANRAGHHAAGRWLADHMNPSDKLVDPFCWAHFYSGEFFREGQTRPPAGPLPVAYVVWEQSNNQHSRLPTMKLADTIRRDGAIVYSWPENRPVDQATVVVYRNPPP
jgi:hypothetical protein